MDEDGAALDTVLGAEAVYSERPEAVPGDLRPGWRIAALVMLLDRSHGKSATLEQIHVIGWAMLADKTREIVLAALEGKLSPDSVLVRYDPSWSRAIDLAVGFGLAAWTNTGRLALSREGAVLAGELWEEEEVLLPERSFLSKFRVSQAMIERLLGGG